MRELENMASKKSDSRIENCFLPHDEDIPFEEDILRNQYSVKHWLRYLDHKKQSKKSTDEAVNMIYERALQSLPGSYKLWNTYLKRRRQQTKDELITSVKYRDLINCYERALVFMHKMPRIWLDYCKLLMELCLVTKVRKTLDRALQALPITQHSRVWIIYIEFIRTFDIPETAIRVYKRYMKIQPEDGEDFVQYLIQQNRIDEAAVKLAELVNIDSFVSKEGKSKHQLWSELCELISKNPDKIRSLNVDAIIKEGISRYTDQQGKLWNSLAEYYIRDGLYDKARDVFEEAIKKVMTIRDFSQVFDAYAQAEEQIVNTMIESSGDDIEIDMRLARLEHLMERRPLLLNQVALRQNPHNVEEWHKRISLLSDKPLQVIETYTTAVETVDDRLSIGKLNSLWIEFAKFYEQHSQFDEARLIFQKGTQADYAKVEDLALVWCEWAEMELRAGCPSKAHEVMKRATAMPSKQISYFDKSESAQHRLYKSLKLWLMYADLEESFGTFKSTKAVYERIIELRIATPQIIINYAMFLETHKYYEEAFKAYEKGIALFKWPVVFDIWNTYLARFHNRYGGEKLERARDLFEQCLEHCPSAYSRNIFFLYARLEEEHGLAKHAMSIYERATQHVQPKHVYDVYNVYIKKAAEMFGLTYTRSIYEKAIEHLPDGQARDMCIRFADLERKLGEIDRARAIYAHCSGMSDPRTQDGEQFWRIWKEFELKHGNEDTIREMLRIKRSVQATFNTQVNLSSQMVSAVQGFVKGDSLDSEKSIFQMKENDFK